MELLLHPVKVHSPAASTAKPLHPSKLSLQCA